MMSICQENICWNNPKIKSSIKHFKLETIELSVHSTEHRARLARVPRIEKETATMG
jgi:hypothetical protein